MKKTLSITPKLIAAFMLLFLILGINTTYGQGANSNTDCLPPQTSVPGGADYIGQFHAKYSDGTNVYDLTQPIHNGFAGCDPPPPVGGNTVHSMSSAVHAQMSVNGAPPIAVQSTGQMTVRVTSTGGAGTTRTFQTEMLQLDIQGGTLPPGVMIRESPTKQSLGQTSITGTGPYHIDSFFDIFTELSVDGGMTWMPSQSSTGQPDFAGRMTLGGTAGIPTLSQWGLIIFSLLFLAVAMVFVAKRRKQMSAE